MQIWNAKANENIYPKIFNIKMEELDENLAKLLIIMVAASY